MSRSVALNFRHQMVAHNHKGHWGNLLFDRENLGKDSEFKNAILGMARES